MDILGRNRKAEELTQEIDVATNVVKNTETEADGTKVVGGAGEYGVVKNTITGVNSEKARGLGNAALREGSAVQFGFGGEAVRPNLGSEQVENNLAKAEAEVAQPERFVGEETPLLREDRLAEDRDDFRREENLPPEGASESERRLLAGEHKIVKNAGKAVTSATVEDVERVLQGKVVHPADLADLWQKRSIEMISKVDGYALGDNN